MLAALKPQLVAETALSVTQLREKEFKYYESHINVIETAATLLAGFSFTAFVTVVEPLTYDKLTFRRHSGSYDVDLTPSDGLTRITTIVEWIDLVSCCEWNAA